jgi:hypothetical protein
VTTGFEKQAAGSSRRTALLAWTLCVLALVMIFASLALTLLGASRVIGLNFPLVGVSGALVGGLVASRKPHNPVGWFFLAGACIGGLQSLAGTYAVYGLIVDPVSVPFTSLSAWLARSFQIVGPIFGFVLVPLYFPNGRPPTPRWRVITWATLVMLPLATALTAFSPGETVYGTGIPNPLAVEALRPVNEALRPIIFVFYIGLMVAAAASLVVRLVRSRGMERKQIEWFVFAAALVPSWFLINRPVEQASPVLFGVLDALIIAGVPVAAGIAILRYRLYDIDRVINRTLVYGSLTVMLALVYLGSVVGLQAALRVLSGQESTLAVVASTLVIAALFNPLRRRVQGFVDRRFYRRKYDAAKTLEVFNARLREETDLDALSGDLLGVASRTVQPEHVSLWLRAETKNEARSAPLEQPGHAK